MNELNDTLYNDESINKRILNKIGIESEHKSDYSGVILDNISSILELNNTNKLNVNELKYLGMEDEYYQNLLTHFDVKLYARVVEGDYGKRPVITMPCSNINYKRLYDIGKKLYKQGVISKYEISVFLENKYIWSIRPDKSNFEMDRIGSDFSKKIYEEIKYRQNNDLRSIEKTYDKVHSILWEDAFKEYGMILEKSNINTNKEISNDYDSYEK